MKNKKPLTPPQLFALLRIHQSTYGLEVNSRPAYPELALGPLEALERRGLVRADRGLGSSFSPRTSVLWHITRAGISAVEDMTPRQRQQAELYRRVTL